MNTTAILTEAGIDAIRRPDGLYVAQCPDGGRVAFGVDGDGDWWDFAVYGADGTILVTDGASTLEAILPALRQWTTA